MTPPGSLPQTPAPARPASGRPGGSRHQGGLLSANTRLAHAASSDVARRSQSVPAGWRRPRQGDPMGRRPTDYTAQMQAAEQRKRQREEREREEQQREQQLRARQAQSYGAVVIDVMGTRMTIDALAGLLLDCRERATADPELEKEWAARGNAYFRPADPSKRPSAKNGGEAGNGQQPGAREPSLPGRAAPARDGDLLGPLAPAHPGPRPASESGEPDGHA